MAADDPLRALQSLATAWRRELNASVIGVTGSTGKTSTKDLLLAILAPHRRTVASPRELQHRDRAAARDPRRASGDRGARARDGRCAAPGRSPSSAAIAEPDVGVIVSIGPVHLELLGTIEAIAAAKAELIAALAPGGTAIVPADEPLLAPHLRADVRDGHLRRGRRRPSCARRRSRWRRSRVEIDLAGRADRRSRSRSRRPICSGTCSPRSAAAERGRGDARRACRARALARARASGSRFPTA